MIASTNARPVVKTETLSLGQLAWLTEKVDALQKRIDRKGLQGSVALALGAVSVDADGNVSQEVTLASSLLQLAGGHTLVGTVEFFAGGLITVNCVPGEEIPEDLRCQGVCEACNTARDRNKLIIVRDPAGRLIRVGSSCVKDYLGVDPSVLMALVEIFSLGCCNNQEREDRESFAKGIGYLVATSNALIKAFGWCSSTNPGEGIPTSHRLKLLLIGGKDAQPLEQAIAPHYTAAHAEVDAILAWLDSQDSTSNYIGNLKALASAGYAMWQHLGLVASLPQAYHRAVEQEAKRSAEAAANAANPSKHLGQVGEKLTLEGIVVGSRVIESYYGSSILVTIQVDADIVKTFTTGSFAEVELNSTVRFAGTVKAHGEYQGKLETTLTRCKLLK